MSEELKCPHCNEPYDEWHWIRFKGLGPWKDKNTYIGCKNCGLRFDGSKVPEIVDERIYKGPSVMIDEPGGRKYY